MQQQNFWVSGLCFLPHSQQRQNIERNLFACCRHVVIADPMQEEEDSVKGLVTIVTTNTNEVCIIHKPSTSSRLQLLNY